MAVVPPEIKAFGTGDYMSYRITWAGMKSGDVGHSVVYPNFANKTISVDGDTVVKVGMQGSNHDRDENDPCFHELYSEDEAMTRRGLYRLTVNPYRLRPYVKEGENVTVIMVVTH
jgi:hypothetical protein